MGGDIMSDKTFAQYANLMFYEGHRPHYFYFSSLATYKGTTDQYRIRAEEVAAKGRKALEPPLSFDTKQGKDMEALKQLSAALDFLRDAVRYERANEIQYFKQKFALLKDKFKDELKIISEVADLKNLFEHGMEENFDYNRMIVLINILEQGLKQTKKVAVYEEERINTIAKQMGAIKASRRRQLDGLWRKRQGISADTPIKQTQEYIEFIERANQRFHNHIEVEYVSHGNLYSDKDHSKRYRIWGAKTYLKDIPETVDVQVGKWITDHISEIFNSNTYMKQFEQLAQQYLNTGDANTDTVREMLVKSITNDGVQHTLEILENTYKNIPINQFIKELEEQIKETRQYRIKGYYSNFGQYGKHSKFFDQTRLKNGKRVADELYDLYAELRKEITKENHKLSKEETLLMSALKSQKHLQTYSRIISLVNKLEKKQREYEKISKEIASGQRKNDTEPRRLNLGASGDGTDIIVDVKITADGVSYDNLTAGINNTSLIKSLGNGRTEATTIKGIIAGLKTKMSHQLRDDLSQAMAQILLKSNKQYTQSQIETAFEKALTGLKLSVGGSKLSEIAPAIKNAFQQGLLTTHFPGHLNRKNDLITISLQYKNITIKSTLKQIIDLQEKDLKDQLDPKLREIQKEYITNFEDKFYSKLSHLKNTDSNFNSLAENEKIWFEYRQEQAEKMEQIEKMSKETDDLWSKFVADAKKDHKSEEEINQARLKILSSLEDSFFISDTMKTYNQYQNNIGFTGASLGANVGAQLNNLNTLFTKAGAPMSQEDVTWLTDAIINCSPVSIVGQSQKNIIENYLSSMAALAMFDEGSAEGQIIQDLRNKVQNRAHSSPKILHLYRVNGLFVPGSVVLQRTIDDLSKCLDMATGALDQKINHTGGGVIIVNTMNEGLIPNRKTTAKRYNYFDTDPWGTVASETDSHVKLKIVFLAGLLDIVNSMNKYMGKIELPK